MREPIRRRSFEQPGKLRGCTGLYLRQCAFQSRTDLLLLHGLLWLRFRVHVCLPFGMKPGTPVLTTVFSRCLI
jgi:hypothetical protein